MNFIKASLFIFALTTFGCTRSSVHNEANFDYEGKGTGVLPWPTKGKITSGFGPRGRRMHRGIDISAPRGTPIVAVRSGVVEFVGWKQGYGKTVIINHHNFKTLYAHCHKIYVSKGSVVGLRQKIASVGRTGNATGNHLHFEYRTMKNLALNPIQYLMDRVKAYVKL